MDTIFLRGFRLDAQIGIYRRERVTTQPVEIDLELAIPSPRAFETGKVADTIDYAKVAERITKEIAEKRFGLVEEMAQAIADIVLNEFGSSWVKVTIAKLGILRDVARVGVSIERSKSGTPDIASRNWQSKESPSGSNPFADSNTSPL
jgi:7,8-dihydroneopterin aldolase/epimerase/oxygenase